MSIPLSKPLPGLGAGDGASSVLPWMARTLAALSRFGNSVWNALEASGARRAERELGRFAAQPDAGPELAGVYRDAIRHLRSQAR